MSGKLRWKQAPSGHEHLQIMRRGRWLDTGYEVACHAIGAGILWLPDGRHIGSFTLLRDAKAEAERLAKEEGL